jgi:DNA modification methylase
MEENKIICGDALTALQTLPAESAGCCVTSPPYYGLRDYGTEGQIGREETPEQYIENLVNVFREVWRVLRTDGTLWLNIADTYCGTGSKGNRVDPKNPKGRTGQQVSLNHRARGCKQKDLIGIPWLAAFALRADGWYLRNAVIWAKDNPMPESAKDRFTRCYEYVFLLAKSKSYYFDGAAVAEPVAPVSIARLKNVRNANKYADGAHGQTGQALNQPRAAVPDELIPVFRNRRDVWRINTVPYAGAHFAAFPPKLAETCILAGCPSGGIVLDPFFGSGTTGLVADRTGRRYIGIDINAEYCRLAKKRIDGKEDTA